MAKLKQTDLELSRERDEMRDVNVEFDFTQNALASVLYKQGATTVLACATKAPRLPRWFPRDASRGWVNAEYSLMPGSTDTRFNRERRGAKGRTMEIERLVARCLRGVVDLEQLGPLALTVDCDILNADGGTRCASITAASLALRQAIRRLIASGDCLPADMRPEHGANPPKLTAEQAAAHERAVMPHDVAAVSVGVIDGVAYLDLDYILDSNADVDMNVVMTSDNNFVEIQGTGEECTFTEAQLADMLSLAKQGTTELHQLQSSLLE